MKASLLAALVALAFPACERKSSDVVPPSATSPILASGQSLPHQSEIMINIDQHGGRIVDERHYDSDSAFHDKLVSRAAIVKPHVRVILRADHRVSYDTIARTLLLIREAGLSEIYLAFRRQDSPREEAYLRLHN